MKNIVLFILQLLFIIQSYAQGTPNFIVDNHTGTGSANFPLYTVISGNLNLPLYLQYDASGVPIEDSGKPLSYINKDYHPYIKNTNVTGNSNSIKIATGWILIAGGIIKRNVKALPDDYLGVGNDNRKGWLYGNGAQTVNNFVSTSDNDLSNCTDESSDFSQLNALNKNVDTEPDIFSFSFGGFSGKFVFDYSTPQGATMRPVRTIPYQDLNISYTTTNNQISSFKIITNTGVVYEFIPTLRIKRTISSENRANNSYFNTTYSRYSNTIYNIEYTEEWGLYSITEPGTSNKITVLYNGTELVEDVVNPLEIVTRGLNSEDYHQNIFYYDQINKKYKIPVAMIGDDNYVNFSTEGMNISKFGEMRNPLAFNTVEINGRTFLKSISEHVNSVKVKEYNFEYSGVYFENELSLLPTTDSYSKDFWGYFNNKENTVLYPKVYIYPSLNGADRYRTHPIPNDNNYHFLEGANRNADAEVVTIGLLTKIVTPFKGQILVNYESNEYYDETANTKFKGGGARVKRIAIHDGISHANDIIKEYEYDLNGGKLLYRPSFAYAVPTYWNASDNTIHSPSQYSGANLYQLFTYRSVRDLNSSSENDNRGVIYQTVSEIQPGKGRVLYTYSMPATNMEVSTNDYASPYNYSATMSKLAREKVLGICGPQGIIENGYSTFPFANNTNYGFERGLLLSEKSYNEEGSLVKEIQKTYSRLYRGVNPYIIKGIKLESHIVNSKPFYQFGQYSLLTDVGNVLTMEKEIIFDQTNANKKLTLQRNYFYESDNHRLLSRTTSTNSSGIINQTKFKYVGDFTATATGTMAVRALYGMNLKNMHANPVEQISSIIRPGETEKVIGATLTKYEFVPGTEISFPAEKFELKIAKPITDFSPVMIGSSDLVYDSRFKLKSKILLWDRGRNIPLEYVDENRIIHSVIMGSPSYLKNADVTNARISEIAFGGFSKRMTTTSPNVRDTYYRATILLQNEELIKNSIMKSPLSSTYNFSAWIDAVNGPGYLTIMLSDGVNTVNSVIHYDGLPGWKFYKRTIPVSSLGNSLTASVISSNKVSLDNIMLLYPSSAFIKYYSYNSFGKLAENDLNGNYTTYDYDFYGRLKHIKDKNNSILQRNSYPSYLPDNHVINADFTYVGEPTAHEPVTFVPSDKSTPGTKYFFDFGDGSGFIESLEHTFNAPGEYLVTLKTVHPEHGENIFSKTILVARRIVASICTTGPLEYSICNGETLYSECATSNPELPGSNTFTVTVHGVSNTAQITYSWEYVMQGINNPIWHKIDNNTNTYHRWANKDDPMSSYGVRCNVTVIDNYLPKVKHTSAGLYITFNNCIEN